MQYLTGRVKSASGFKEGSFKEWYPWCNNTSKSFQKWISKNGGDDGEMGGYLICIRMCKSGDGGGGCTSGGGRCDSYISSFIHITRTADARQSVSVTVPLVLRRSCRARRVTPRVGSKLSKSVPEGLAGARGHPRGAKELLLLRNHNFFASESSLDASKS